MKSKICNDNKGSTSAIVVLAVVILVAIVAVSGIVILDDDDTNRKYIEDGADAQNPGIGSEFKWTCSSSTGSDVSGYANMEVLAQNETSLVASYVIELRGTEQGAKVYMYGDDIDESEKGHFIIPEYAILTETETISTCDGDKDVNVYTFDGETVYADQKTNLPYRMTSDGLLLDLKSYEVYKADADYKESEKIGTTYATYTKSGSGSVTGTYYAESDSCYCISVDETMFTVSKGSMNPIDYEYDGKETITINGTNYDTSEYIKKVSEMEEGSIDIDAEIKIYIYNDLAYMIVIEEDSMFGPETTYTIVL